MRVEVTAWNKYSWAAGRLLGHGLLISGQRTMTAVKRRAPKIAAYPVLYKVPSPFKVPASRMPTAKMSHPQWRNPAKVWKKNG